MADFIPFGKARPIRPRGERSADLRITGYLPCEPGEHRLLHMRLIGDAPAEVARWFYCEKCTMVFGDPGDA
jgi:hypothetical protein